MQLYEPKALELSLLDNARITDRFQKRTNLQVSCSYGPGCYDLNYESEGQDILWALFVGLNSETCGTIQWLVTAKFNVIDFHGWILSKLLLIRNAIDKSSLEF